MVCVCFGTGFYIGEHYKISFSIDQSEPETKKISINTSILSLNYTLIVTKNLTKDEIKFLITKEVINYVDNIDLDLSNFYILKIPRSIPRCDT